jgi:hypothetical protein
LRQKVATNAECGENDDNNKRSAHFLIPHLGRG